MVIIIGRHVSILVVALVLGTGTAAGQDGPPEDSLRSYDLEEIVVSSGQAERVSSSTVQRVSLAGIARQDAPTVGRVAHLVPAAYVQTNSRGETLVYLRNSGERQVAVFFDGALLNIPWDNRVDLSLIPTSVIGGMTVAKGVPSVVYGTNVIGGAMNLTSRQLEEPGRHGEFSLSGGYPRAVNGHATYLFRRGPLAVTAAGGYSERIGDALPAGADLPYSQSDEAIRTNTDRRLSNLFGKASYRTSRGDAVGISLLHVAGGRGIAPESHIDPTSGRVRYWRHPSWRNSTAVLTGDFGLGSTARVRASAWGTGAHQRIHQYDSMLYDEVNTQHDNTDWVGGGRAVLDGAWFGGSVQAAANFLTSVHRLQEITSSATQRHLSYQQHVFSFGSAFQRGVGPSSRLDLGASIDGAAMPQTGDHPPRDPYLDYSVSAGFVHRVAASTNVRAAVGRKVRFPTMRELFGEALRRFSLNPDLSPETSRSVEAGASLRRQEVTLEVTGFLRKTRDTIDQLVLADGRRMRVNLEDSRVAGVETFVSARPTAGWNVDGHLTWMQARAFEKGQSRPLAERPGMIGMASVGYTPPQGFAVLTQVAHLGAVHSMDEDGALVELSPATLMHARASYRTLIQGVRPVFAELFLRVDNLADASVTRQLGLPDPGRELTAGVNLAF